MSLNDFEVTKKIGMFHYLII